MKKVSLMLLLCLFLLTGCGENRLVCTLKEEDPNYTIESKYTFQYNQSKVKKATMKSTVTLLGEYNTEDMIKDREASARSAATEYNETDGINATVSTQGNKVTLTVDILSGGLSDTAKENYGMNTSKAEWKSELEEAGYTCK